ncbi:FtsX-like permease family protein [uncultured Microbacterium sp.]|uniref:FtsX-like permease family protein n=1 Tax=uncultured Microbacterium sp. TaxID=191216 RepID=UPI0028D69942|nr:FtsX-like permease family protein [uncultured Microbacterium sp.]
MTERRGPAGLLAKQARADAALLALIGFVVAISALLVTAAPAALAQIATQELRHTLDGFPAVRGDLTASGIFGYPSAGGNRSTAEGIASISDTIERAPDGVGEPLAALLEDSQWVALTPREGAEIIDGPTDAVLLRVGLAMTPGADDLVTITDGTPPQAWTGDEDDSATPTPPLEVALSRSAAERMGIAVGDTLDHRVAPLLVTALYEPRDDSDPFWQHQAALSTAVERVADDGRTLLLADVLVDPASTAGLSTTFAGARVEAWYPLRTDRFSFDDARAVAQQVRQLSAAGEVFRSGEFLLFSSILASDIDAIIQRVNVATALMVLLAAGPVGVVLAVLALAAQAIARRRRPTLDLARVRGAGETQLRMALLLEGFAIALPAGMIGMAIGMAISAAIDGSGPLFGVDAWPALAVVIALPPVLLAASLPPPPLVARSRTAGFRWVGEVLVVALAAASVFLLVRRGVVGDGADPLPAAAPLLVAAAGTLGVLRLFPLVMRTVQRGARHGSGAIAVVGAAQAARGPAPGFATAFAIILGTSVAVFSLGAARTLQSALASASASTGSSARREIPPLDAGHPLVAAVFGLLAVTVAAVLAFCLVAMVLGVLASARQRDGVLGVLRVLGLPARGLRGVVGWEVAPVLVFAISAGVVLGVAEVLVVLTAIDLPGFAGVAGSPPLLDVTGIAVVVVVLAAAAGAAALSAAAIARRRSPAASLRMGVE